MRRSAGTITFSNGRNKMKKGAISREGRNRMGKALILNISKEAAEPLYSGRTAQAPCSQIPDMAHKLNPVVYLCVRDFITGRARYISSTVSREPLENSKADCYGLNVVWNLSEIMKLSKPKPVAAYGIKRPPEEWKWARGIT